MEVNLKHIVGTLAAFAKDHHYLQGNFYSGDESLLPSNQSYPLMLVRTRGLELIPNQLSFSMDLMVVDRKVGQDLDQILSDTAYVLEDLRTILEDNFQEYGFELQSMSEAQVIDDRLSDDVIGWYTVVRFYVISTRNENQVARL